MNEEIAIKIENISKNFLLPHEKKTSLKSVFTSLFGGKTTYTQQHALNDISFEVKKGEFFGIVGRNGSGKSTLLKIIAGIYQPTNGKLQVNGKLVPFIELGVGFNPELTGRENVYLNGSILGFTRKQIQKNYKQIVEFAELHDFMDQKLANYSSGMQVRLAFACATRAKAEILLIDEVLAVGDADFQRKCFSYFKSIKKIGVTVIFVTHDMGSVREFCDRALLIDNNQIKAIGRPDLISSKYSRLFINDNKKQKSAVTTKRWGTAEVIYRKVNIDVNENKIIIKANISASLKKEAILYGIHINSEDGKEIFATNNRMIQKPDISTINGGESIQIHWEIQNIFADGKYFVTLTLADPVSVVYDWCQDIEYFVIKKESRSTTSIMPPTTVTTKLNTGAER